MQTFIRYIHSLCYSSTDDVIVPPSPTPRPSPRPNLDPKLRLIEPSELESVAENMSSSDDADSRNAAAIMEEVIHRKIQNAISDIKETLHSEVRSIVAVQLHSTLKNIVAAELSAKINHKISIAKKEIMAEVSGSGVASAATTSIAAAIKPPQSTCEVGTQYGSAALLMHCACNKHAGLTCLLHSLTLKEVIHKNKPIEQNLHVIAVISNPCNFRRREQLMHEFTKRMEKEPNVILYTVELAYGDQPFRLTTRDCPRHLQLRAKIPLWHKENMINLGVRYLLPRDWRAMAWIDADIDFENPSWALDTLKVLNGYRDIVQLFSHAVDMDASEATMNVYNSFGFQHDKGLPYTYKFPNYWHPGYAWAVTREAFEKMRTPGDPYSGIFELGILGASDHIMTFCYRGNGLASINDKYTAGFKDEITRFEGRVRELRLGYVPGVIRHYFHGSKVNRKYVERNEILLRYHYDPARHITRDASGVFVPTAEFPGEFAREIYEYFVQRNEDE